MAKRQFIAKEELIEMAAMVHKGYPIAAVARYFHRDIDNVRRRVCDFLSPYRDIDKDDAGATNTKDDSTLRIRCRGCGYKVSRVCKSAPTTCMGCHMKQSGQVLTKTVLRRF
jgi:hypothetical protein